MMDLKRKGLRPLRLENGCGPDRHKLVNTCAGRRSGASSQLMISNRPLYVAAYDIGDARRQAEARELLKGYSIGGQKSVYECFLSEPEKRRVIPA